MSQKLGLVDIELAHALRRPINGNIVSNRKLIFEPCNGRSVVFTGFPIVFEKHTRED